jgi:hypothetical protein
LIVSGGITIVLVTYDETHYTSAITHVLPFTADDLRLLSISDRICGIEKLVTLYPNIPKMDAFGRFAMPRQRPLSGGYVRPGLSVTIDPPSTASQAMLMDRAETPASVASMASPNGNLFNSSDSWPMNE